MKVVGDLFTEHLREQFAMDSSAAPNNAFDPHWFIEAMLNPPVNHILLALDGDRAVGFSRMGILYGNGLIPLGGPVRRSESSYLKRLPVIILSKCRDLINSLLSRIEKRRTIAQMSLPIQKGYIADFYIAPDCRRKGIGVALYKASKEWFASRGILTMDLQYLAANESGKAFWKAMGFENYRMSARQNIAGNKK